MQLAIRLLGFSPDEIEGADLVFDTVEELLASAIDVPVLPEDEPCPEDAVGRVLSVEEILSRGIGCAVRRLKNEEKAVLKQWLEELLERAASLSLLEHEGAWPRALRQALDEGDTFMFVKWLVEALVRFVSYPDENGMLAPFRAAMLDAGSLFLATCETR